MADNANPPTPTTGHGSGDFDGEYTRIEVESFETTDKGGYGQSPRFLLPKPPFWSTWICLLLAWFFLASPIPFTVFIGLPLNLAALVLAFFSLGRGGIKTGQNATEVSGAPGQWLTVGELSTSQEGQGAALSNPSRVGVASGSERQTLQIRVTRQ